MAIIVRFEKKEQPRIRKDQTGVDCAYFTFNDDDGKRYIQLETYGSSERENPGKTSQVLRLSEETARLLVNILQSEVLR